MAYSTPYTFVAGELIDASILNAYLRDNMKFLKGTDGVVTIDNSLIVGALSTDGVVDTVDVSSHVGLFAYDAHSGLGDHTHTSSGAEGGTLSVGLIASTDSITLDQMPDALSGLFLMGQGLASSPVYSG